jgi:hypothetical protein
MHDDLFPNSLVKNTTVRYLPNYSARFGQIRKLVKLSPPASGSCFKLRKNGKFLIKFGQESFLSRLLIHFFGENREIAATL